MGFTSILSLIRNWWSLTPPFHPYLTREYGGLFSAALSIVQFMNLFSL